MEMEATASLLFDISDGLATLTLHRPEKLNALDTRLFDQLDAALGEIEARADRIGCVLLRGTGRAFCAGADLSAIAKGIAAPPTMKPRVIERLANLPPPVVVRVHGDCFTGGLELALAADIIVAGHNARFADTHGKWGLVAGWGMTQRLPRRVGMAQAKLMSFTGRVIGGIEAGHIGLADLCVADDILDTTVLALSRDILANSGHSNRAVKALLRETDGLPLSQGLAHEHYRNPGQAPDVAERVAAFANRKRPLE